MPELIRTILDISQRHFIRSTSANFIFTKHENIVSHLANGKHSMFLKLNFAEPNDTTQLLNAANDQPNMTYVRL